MRIVVDMNLSPAWAAFLCENGYAAQHWTNIGPVDASDSAIMAYARENGAVVLTNDLDFGDILAATGGDAPSVVQIRAADLSVTALGAVLLEALQVCREALESGALVTLHENRTRVTVLPIVR